MLVDEIADEYQASVRSPPASPQPTPVRPSTQTARSASLPTITTTSAPNSSIPTLPDHVREQMLAPWSAEASLASIENHTSSRPLSLNTHGTNNTNNHLTTNGTSPTTSNRNASPSGAAAANVYQNRFDGTPAARHFSARHRTDQHLGTPTESSVPGSALSSKRSLVRVNELKRALDGRTASASTTSLVAAPLTSQNSIRVRKSERHSNALDGNVADDTASESMVSASIAGSVDGEDEYPEGALPIHAAGNARMSSIGSESQYQYQPRFVPEPSHQQRQSEGGVPGTGTQDFAARLFGESTSLGVPYNEQQGKWNRGGSVGSAVSGLSAANGGKVDLATLLDEIEVGDENEEKGQGREGIGLGRGGGSVRGVSGRPPY